MGVRRLEHYNLLTTKFDQTIAFYSDVLGMRVGRTPSGDAKEGALEYTTLMIQPSCTSSGSIHRILNCVLIWSGSAWEILQVRSKCQSSRAAVRQPARCL